MATRGKSARTRGHNYECQIVQEFCAMGKPCKTSRYASRINDDAKIDITFDDAFPFNIQCKALNVFKSPIVILGEMPDSTNYNLVFQKINHEGEFVTMKKEDFYDLLKLMFGEGIL